MPKPLLVAERSLNPALLALKPRQFLISRPIMVKEETLKPDQKVVLLRSIAQYLDRCGFSKCFKKLLSEAEIEKKELDSTVPDLEELYSEFLNKSEDVKAEADNVDENASGEQETTDKKEKKKKKKKKKEVAVNGTIEETAMEGVESAEKETKDVTEEEKVKETDAQVEDEVKEKKKKKKKEKKADVAEEEKVEETDAQVEDGVKEKKKKKKKSKSVEDESLGGDDKEKSSKKRKRSEPEEAKEQTEDDDDDDEAKRRKKEDNDVEADDDVQETPVKQTDTEENGNVEKSETKSTNKKSGNGLSSSKEPKKPFQRVNVEDVVFTDERLKDNSYWAKDGADVGYGAKAQEVLGQVRGRGFRHEKTKKKRGSYRGGEIDLQSHSVKFDNSDEE